MDRSVPRRPRTNNGRNPGEPVKISLPGRVTKRWLGCPQSKRTSRTGTRRTTGRCEGTSGHLTGAVLRRIGTRPCCRRVRPFLPTGTICEIAPGYGRWTQYLLGECDQYVGVDLASRCVDACRERFSSFDHARFEVNDGRSLPMLESDSVDFVFSFDSLVHVEADVIAQYLVELARVLRRDGIAWLHHSNLGEFSHQVRRMEQAEAVAYRSSTLRSWLRRCGAIEWRHGRAESMTARSFCRPGNPGSAQVRWTGNRELGQRATLSTASLWSRVRVRCGIGRTKCGAIATSWMKAPPHGASRRSSPQCPVSAERLDLRRRRGVDRESRGCDDAGECRGVAPRNIPARCPPSRK